MVARARSRVGWLARSGAALTLADAAAVVVAGLLAREAAVPVLASSAAAVLVARAAGLHRPRLVLSVLDDLPGLLVTAATATAVAAWLGEASATFGLLALAGLVLAHTAVYAAARLLRRSGRRRRRVLVVGTGSTARHLTLTLLATPELGLEPTGFVGTGPEADLSQARGLPLTMLGPVSNLPRAMSEVEVDAVVVALPGPAGDEEAAALEGLLATSAEVYAVPGSFSSLQAHTRQAAELVGGVPLVRLHRRRAWPPVRALRRLVEVLVALLALIPLLPLAAVLAVLVLLETGGVLVRVPGDGRGRSATRYRTRRARSVGRPGTTFSVAISGRLGPVGRLLRRTRLDALPELLGSLLRRLRYAGGVPDDGTLVSAAAPHADQPQVDASQLAR